MEGPKRDSDEGMKQKGHERRLPLFLFRLRAKGWGSWEKKTTQARGRKESKS